MKIKIHSIVDVVTNSSSVTYVIANNNTIKLVKQLIEALSPGMSEKFNYELFRENLKERREDLIEEDLADNIENWDSYSYQECRERIQEKYDEYMKAEEKPDYWDDPLEDYSNVNLVVTPKENNEKDRKIAELLNKLNNLFDYGSTYDG